MEHINWYPGHMKKTRELIQENLKLVDIVLEVVDARIPVSSRNPLLGEITGSKRRILALNKSDLSDAGENQRWLEHFRGAGLDAMQTNSMAGEGVKQLVKMLESIQKDKNEQARVKRPLRMMIAGVPNVGKSSLINRLTGRRSAQTGDRPGVTKGKQWLALKNGMQLLDTPGILWPKLEGPRAGINLALCGSIKDEILDIESLALEFLAIMLRDYPNSLSARYKIQLPGILERDGEGRGSEETPPGEPTKEAALGLMESIALKRGYILPGKKIDYMRTAKTLMDEFRGGDLGRITLEKPIK